LIWIRVFPAAVSILNKSAIPRGIMMTEKIEACSACADRSKELSGASEKCAFTKDGFEKNLNCATVNMIRDICFESEFAGQECISYKYATINISDVDIHSDPLAPWVSWCKNKGATQAMWLLFDNAPPRHPTET